MNTEAATSGTSTTPRLTHRQRAWSAAHDQAEQEVGDVFGWWIAMQVKGRLRMPHDAGVIECLRRFNAVQVTPLPFVCE